MRIRIWFWKRCWFSEKFLIWKNVWFWVSSFEFYSKFIEIFYSLELRMNLKEVEFFVNWRELRILNLRFLILNFWIEFRIFDFLNLNKERKCEIHHWPFATMPYLFNNYSLGEFGQFPPNRSYNIFYCLRFRSYWVCQ